MEQLILACKEGNYTKAQELLKLGTRLSDKIILKRFWDACDLGYIKIVKLLFEYHHVDSIGLSLGLTTALENQNYQLVEFLLDNGADIHTYYDYPLRMTVMFNKTELVNKLIKAGANVHVLDNFALRQAVRNGNYTITKLLLYSGATPASVNGRALKDAILDKNEQILNLLLIHTKIQDTPENLKEKWHRLQRGLITFQRKCVVHLWRPEGTLCSKNYLDLNAQIRLLQG